MFILSCCKNCCFIENTLQWISYYWPLYRKHVYLWKLTSCPDEKIFFSLVLINCYMQIGKLKKFCNFKNVWTSFSSYLYIIFIFEIRINYIGECKIQILSEIFSGVLHKQNYTFITLKGGWNVCFLLIKLYLKLSVCIILSNWFSRCKFL